MLPPAEARFRTSRVIHAAMIASTVVYAGVVHALALGAGWQPVLPPDQARLMRWAFHLLAAGLVITVLVMRSRRLSPETLVALARRTGADATLRQLQNRWITLLAQAEAIALFGLVLFLLGGRLADFYGLWAASLLCQLALTPRRELWEEIGRSGRVR